MLKIQVQGHDFIVDVVHVDSMEEPEGDKTMCMAKVGNVTFQYSMPTEKAYDLFKADLASAILRGEIQPSQPQPVPFLVVQYRHGFMIDWGFHERHLHCALMASHVAAAQAKGIADAAISKAAGGPAIN